MQVRRDYIGALNAVFVSALLGGFFTVAKAEAPNPVYMNDFCRAVAMFDIVDQEWGKALITGAKSRVANEAKKQANDARVLFTKLTNSSFDKFDEDWKRACGYTEVLNSQEILIRSDNPFKDTVFLSNLDEAKSLYRRWERRVEAERKEALNRAKPEDSARGDRNEVLAEYADAIRARVRSRISFDPARAPDNPEVTFIVEQQSTGRIVKVTNKKSSGNLFWDQAVERALWASSPLPKTSDGRVENPITFAFRPLDR